MALNLFWAPGQSLASKNICDHLGRKEKSIIALSTFTLGMCLFFIPLILLSRIANNAVLGNVLVGYEFPLVVVLGIVAWSMTLLQTHVLLDSPYARQNGHTVADLRSDYPLSRREAAMAASPIFVVVLIALAGIWMVFA